ncbi:TPA: cation:proton antiporter, partial [Candidatus Woesearchaeota archaeon]|nr:cation:proton antiporter [Candidatus Woesearchaeota archaeon]HIH31941.1 cation:proton antiporter [Candidatus Woesearchaeota archaeon]HIH55489.1 cation:proton antiporter [Candidatus Woesearchaeota archaeon]HIJ01046.1 cation:proton antiporter [Candidatus Woesearchaeota archaeon]HIJ14729.1 cation:proton antiporter [Candidatus Woesearchaeota archaeon]
MADVKIFMVLAAMLLFAIIGTIISKKLKQPVSVGIIVLGIVLGPSILGIAEYDGTIAVIANLGSIVLLFVAGLNSNIKEVYTKKNFYVAFFGALVPLLGGFTVSALFGYDIYISIFVGSTLTATCLGITSSVLKEIGKIKTDTAKAMIGAAVIDDIISLSILSIVISVPGGIGPTTILLKLAMVIGFVLFMLFFGEKLLTWMLDKFNEHVIRTAPRQTFVLGLAIVFLFSYIAFALGLAPIVGAFLVGVSLSKSKAINTLLAGSEYFEIIFTSIFFISIGIVVELNAFVTLFWFIIVLTAVAILTKMIGSGYTAYKMGFKKKDALIIGTGMAPRGEVAFIIALNGLLLGVITKEIYSAIVFMSFLTTIITLILLKYLYNAKGSRSDSVEEIDFIEMKIKR